MATGRLTLENHLLPFLRRFGLRPDWHTDTLLRLEPHPGSASARAVLDFEAGFWEAFADLNEKAEKRALDEILVRLVGPYDPARRGETLVVVGSLALLKACARASRARRPVPREGAN